MLDDLLPLSSTPLRHVANPRAGHGPWPSRLNTVIDEAAFAEAAAEIRSWPDYAPTPLVELAPLARSLGVAGIAYKDESPRFHLGSFKALGGAYAVLRLLMRETGLDAATIRRGAGAAGALTVVTATDGNHGRSVAWGASRFGCRCRIYIHAGVSDYREQAMRELGAEVVRVDGNYDDSVHRAAEEAAANGWFVVSDTSWPGYEELPRFVMAGYGVLVDEVLAAREGRPPLSHVFVQGGVGGLAAAVAARLWMATGEQRPRLVVVEPSRADCLYQSACNAAPVRVSIEEETIMAGLSCGEVSMLAWSILETAADHFLTITDDNVALAMRYLARATAPVQAGESAVAGLCGFVQAARDTTLARVIGLDGHSQVLLLGTEGATDPAIYAALTATGEEGQG